MVKGNRTICYSQADVDFEQSYCYERQSRLKQNYYDTGRSYNLGTMPIVLRRPDCGRNQPDLYFQLKFDRPIKRKPPGPCAGLGTRPPRSDSIQLGTLGKQSWSTSSSVIGNWVNDERVKNQTWYLPNKTFPHKLGDVYKYVDEARLRDRISTIMN
uniref:Uncharacterized protein n=1 Tax=Cacopsylla melanoneura TaxID=428564 RepID=A0A8D9BH67_9HEMI